MSDDSHVQQVHQGRDGQKHIGGPGRISDTTIEVCESNQALQRQHQPDLGVTQEVFPQ